MAQPFSIAIHGGAGTLVKGQMTPEKETAYKHALELALDVGYALLKKGASAVDAVEKAVAALEDSPLFNAGKGSVFTADGTHEMDAAIMNGKTLDAGAVSLISGIKNPIALARDVMEKSEHIFLAGNGAMKFAKSLGYTLEDVSYFHDEFRYQQWQEIKGTDQFQLDHSAERDSAPRKDQESELDSKSGRNSGINEKARSKQGSEVKKDSKFEQDPESRENSGLDENSAAGKKSKFNKESKFGTVGAVACDRHGNLAAATSTGGMTNKRFGRIGDSPLIGVGNYANNKTCAVSCTGSGEYFIKGVVAYDVSCLMEYKGLSLIDAASEVIDKRLLDIGGDGGLIAADVHGNISMPFNTEGMYRGSRTSLGENKISIYSDSSMKM